MSGKHSHGLGSHIRQFFTNWNEYEGSIGRKVALTLRNRSRSTFSLKWCCGHHGEPGC